MLKDFNDELKTMTRLINYGVNESSNAPKSSSVIEYQSVGADGKNYAIIRECNKYYIKVAPKKNTALVTEDYDYIGGFNNKKENEYTSYNVASKQFELKMKSLNEQYEKKGESLKVFNPKVTAEWQTTDTKLMREEINRFNDLVYNVDGILSEDKNFVPKSTVSVKGNPYTVKSEAKGDKDIKAKPIDHKTCGGINPCKAGEKCCSSEDVYCEEATQIENNISTKSKSKEMTVKGGKCAKHKTVGPYTEKPCKTSKAGICVYEGLNRLNEEYVDVDDVEGLEPINDFYSNDEPIFDTDDNIEFEEPSDNELEITIDDDFEDDTEDDFEDEWDAVVANESKYRHNKTKLTESEFGKHPRYRKQPMTLPPNSGVLKKGTKMWKPKKDHVDEPFGQRIGSSAPYTDNVTDSLTDMICDVILGKKKA